jgi:hypothetical protein
MVWLRNLADAASPRHWLVTPGATRVQNGAAQAPLLCAEAESALQVKSLIGGELHLAAIAPRWGLPAVIYLI